MTMLDAFGELNRSKWQRVRTARGRAEEWTFDEAAHRLVGERETEYGGNYILLIAAASVEHNEAMYVR